jgi:hypothetical protein
MKFVLTTDHTYFWPVKVILPNPARAGATMEQSFTVKFRALTRKQGDEFEAMILDLPTSEQDQRKHDFLKEIVLDWDESVVDEAKSPVPFSSEALDQAMQMNWFLTAVYRAYSDSLNGGKARRGN